MQRASSHFDNLRRRTDIASKFPLYLKYDIYIGQVWATGTQDFNPSTQAAVFDVDATFDTDQSHRRMDRSCATGLCRNAASTYHSADTSRRHHYISGFFYLAPVQIIIGVHSFST